MAVECGARKEERRRNVLHAVVRYDQRLQYIALALGKSKGGHKAVESIVKRKLQRLQGHRVGLIGRTAHAKIVGGKRQSPVTRFVLNALSKLPQQRDRNADKQHEYDTHRHQHVLARDNRHRRSRHKH